MNQKQGICNVIFTSRIESPHIMETVVLQRNNVSLATSTTQPGTRTISQYDSTGSTQVQYHISHGAISPQNHNLSQPYPTPIRLMVRPHPRLPQYISDKISTSMLLTHHLTQFCISTSQICAAGKSNRGGYTGTLECSPDYGGDFAAFTACSGVLYRCG